jgi:hypothetical protein
MQQLDDDVGVTVRLEVRPLAAVDGMGPVRGRVEAEQADHAADRRRV